jgi:hypothetical protein
MIVLPVGVIVCPADGSKVFITALPKAMMVAIVPAVWTETIEVQSNAAITPIMAITMFNASWRYLFVIMFVFPFGLVAGTDEGFIRAPSAPAESPGARNLDDEGCL